MSWTGFHGEGTMTRMGRRLTTWPLAAALAAFAAGAGADAGAAAGVPMTYRHNAPESDRDVRYDFQWEILRTALERTRARWGDFRLLPSERMTEQRQAYELRSGTGKLTVMYLDATPENERTLVPVRIPVDRSLVGYRVLLVRKDDRHRFAGVRTADDLRRFKIGQGLGWSDVDVLRANGFDVVTGSSYDGLFEMLVHRRFDVFPRAATEVLEEVEHRKAELPELHVEESVLLYYPLPMYFWFSPTADGRRLAARAEEGMRAMLADGTYDAIFDRHQRPRIEALRLGQRRLITLPNPLLGPETPFSDRRLWFDPRTYR